MSFIKRILYVFTNYNDIDALIEDKQIKRRKAKEERERYYLQLCHKHQQALYRSEFSSHNCDYCKTLALIEEADKKHLRIKE